VTAVSPIGNERHLRSTNNAIIDLTTFNGQLYAALAGLKRGPDLAFPNGTDWSK